MLSLLSQVPAQAAEASSALPDFYLPYIKTLAILAALVIVAVIVLKFLVPRFGFLSRNKHKVVAVENRFSLEPRKHLYVVRVAKRHFILGTTDQQIQVIAELKPDELDDFLAQKVEL